MPATYIAGRKYEVITHTKKVRQPLLVNGLPAMETVRGGKGAKQRVIMRQVEVQRTQLVRVDKSPKLGRRKRAKLAAAAQQSAVAA